jgi:CBS domain-containing protein
VKTIAQVIEGKTAPIATVEAGSTVLDALKELAIHNIGAVLVTDAGSLVGIVSIGDMVKETIAYQQFLIAQLEAYITT